MGKANAWNIVSPYVNTQLQVDARVKSGFLIIMLNYSRKINSLMWNPAALEPWHLSRPVTL